VGRAPTKPLVAPTVAVVVLDLFVTRRVVTLFY
jgi:hypothetical protein